MQQYESAMSWKAHDGEVYSVEFSYDENTVFSVGEDGKVCMLGKNPFWRIINCNRFEVACFYASKVYPVEHSPVWGKAVRTGSASGRHWTLHLVGLQWL